MKFSIKRKIIFTALALSFISLALVSCSKFDDDDYQPVEVSGLNIIQASPTLELLDVYVDGRRANGLEFEFGSKIGYLSAYSGNRIFDVAKRNSQTSLKSLQYVLKPQLGYSLFVVNTLANIEFLMLEDNLQKPAAGKAKVRFVNLSPDAGALSLNVNGATTDIVSSKAFKEYSDFVVIDAAENVSFNIKNTNNTVETALSSIKVEDGKTYTIYAKGLKANNDDTRLSAKLFAH
jgi:hypothetical protein